MGGCGGGCPKKQLKLKSDLQGIPRSLLEEIRNYVDHPVLVKDRVGVMTIGKCVDLWVDETQTGELIEIGSVAVATKTGINFIGLSAIDSIELISPTTHQ